MTYLNERREGRGGSGVGERQPIGRVYQNVATTAYNNDPIASLVSIDIIGNDALARFSISRYTARCMKKSFLDRSSLH